MNVVILGAGNVGRQIAEMLCVGDHSITLVDSDKNKVRRCNEELDVRAIHGHASQSSILFQAGVSTADIVLAVTGSDEANIIAASMAKSMGVRRSIARVYAPVFRDLSTFDYRKHFRIDRLLSLEHLTAMELARCIRMPESVLVEHFVRGDLQVQEFSVTKNCQATQRSIRDLNLPSDIRIGTIKRQHKIWIANAEDQLEVGDRVTVICRPSELARLKGLFSVDAGDKRRVVIAGGGETGLHLARILEHERFKLMIIEQDSDRCNQLATQLGNVTVINAVATDAETLEEYRVGNADVFVATTGDDEDNMILGVRANDLGTPNVLATIGRPDYAKIVQRLGIDHAISARDVMAKQVRSYLNEGNVVSRNSLPGSTLSVVEVDIQGPCRAVEVPIAALGLPDGCLIVAKVEQDQVIVPGAKDRFQVNDTAILLLDDCVMDQALSAFSA